MIVVGNDVQFTYSFTWFKIFCLFPHSMCVCLRTARAFTKISWLAIDSVSRLRSVGTSLKILSNYLICGTHIPRSHKYKTMNGYIYIFIYSNTSRLDKIFFFFFFFRESRLHGQILFQEKKNYKVVLVTRGTISLGMDSIQTCNSLLDLDHLARKWATKFKYLCCHCTINNNHIRFKSKGDSIVNLMQFICIKKQRYI